VAPAEQLFLCLKEASLSPRARLAGAAAGQPCRFGLRENAPGTCASTPNAQQKPKRKGIELDSLLLGIEKSKSWKKGKGAKKRVSEDTPALGETKRTNPILHNFRWP
jgi:hypothetical protein